MHSETTGFNDQMSNTQISARGVLFAFGVGFALTSLLFLRHVFGVWVFPYDYEFYHFPLWKFVFDSMRDGVFPYYDAYTYSGVPFLENAQSMLFYPPVALFLFLRGLLPGDLTIHQVQFINIFHFAVLYSGIVTWARSRSAALWLAHGLAISSAFAGTIIGNAQHAGVIAALAWLPWLLIVTHALIERPRASLIVALAGLMALVLLSGFLPITAAIQIGWAIYAIVATVNKAVGDRANFSIRWLLALAGSFIVAEILHVLVSAPMWMGVLLEMRMSDAVGLPGPSAWTGALSLLAPDALYHFNFSRYNAFGDPTATYHYAGILPFIALGLIIRPHLALRNASFVAAILCFLLSRDSFHLVQFVQSIPFIGVLYRPALLEPISLILLISSLAPLSIETLRRPAMAGAVIAAIGSISLAGTAYYLDKPTMHVLQIVLVTIASIAGMAGIGLAPKTDHARRILYSAIGIVFIFHAAVTNQIWTSNGSRSESYGAQHVDFTNRDVIMAMRGDKSEPYRVAVDQEILGSWFNGGMRVLRLEAITGFEPSLDTAYLDYLSEDLSGWHSNRTFGGYNLDSPKFDSLNVKYLLTHTDEPFDDPHWELVYNQYYQVYRKKDFAPRFQLASKCAADDKVEIKNHRSGATDLVVWTACKDASLLISERPHKGWQILVDGEETAWKEIDPAIGIEVAIPEGRYSISMVYRTPRFWLSYLLSALGLLLCGALLFIPERKSATSN